MSLSLAIFTFINVWWLMLFFVLPIGVKASQNRSPTEYAGAPQPHPWRKMLLTNTVLSLAATLLIALTIKSGIVPLHDMLDVLS